MSNPSLRFMLLFLVLVGLGFWAERAWYRPVSPYLTRAYASATTATIALLTPGQAVSRQESVISSANVPIIEVTRECDGMNSFILLASALLALPMSLTRKTAGLALGFLLTTLCNFVRITALFYIFKYFPAKAETVHVYLGPLVIMLPALVFFLHWSRRAPDEAPHAAPAE